MEHAFEVEGPAEETTCKRDPKVPIRLLVSVFSLVLLLFFCLYLILSKSSSPLSNDSAFYKLVLPAKERRLESIMQPHYSVSYIPPLHFARPGSLAKNGSCPLASAALRVHRDSTVVKEYRIDDPCSRNEFVVQPPRDAKHVDRVWVSLEFANSQRHQQSPKEYESLAVTFTDDMAIAKFAFGHSFWYQRQSVAFCALHSINSILVNEFKQEDCPMRSMTELITPAAAEPVATELSDQLNGGMFDSASGDYDARVLMPLLEQAVAEMNAKCGDDGMAVVLQQVWYHLDGEPEDVDQYGNFSDDRKRVWAYRELDATLVPYFNKRYQEDRVLAVHRSVELIGDGLHYYALGFTLKKDSDKESFDEWFAREWLANNEQQLALICKDANHFFALMRVEGAFWADLNSLPVKDRGILKENIYVKALHCEFVFALVKP